jgi:hypothetical protein
MSPRDEKRFLTAVLDRVDRVHGGWLAKRWALAVVWVGLVLASTLAFAVSRLLPHWGSALLFVVLGVVYSQLYFRVFAARGWRVLRQHVNRESLVSRLSQLGT